MELSKWKKWIQPAIMALPPKRTIILSLILFLLALSIIFPLFNRWIYPLEYEEYILKSAKATGADPYLVMAIIRVETKFKADKQSRVGAQGLMQLMPHTVDFAIRYGNFSPAFRYYVKNPAANIQMGSWYIAYLTKRFKGNKVAVMAAYNAGPNKVTEWIQKGIWDGSRAHVQKIPYGETRHYVQRVSFFYEKYRSIYGHLVEKN